MDLGGGEGPNCQNNALDSLSKPSTTVLDSRVIELLVVIGKKLTFKFSAYIYLNIGPSTPYVHLASTRVLNAPREDIYFFAGLLLPCIIVNANGR